jgi:hypothetical protein
MKIAPKVYNSILEDFKVICAHYNLNKSELTIRDLWGMLNIVSRNRAFDDSHPQFADKTKRVLPYDGREYCFYYADGCNDDHVKTALNKILKELNEKQN